MDQTQKALRVVFTGASLTALLWLALLYFFTLLAWVELGHFPLPSTNDPKELGLDLIHFIVLFGFFFAVGSVFLWVILLPFAVRFQFLSRWKVLLFVSGFTLFLIQLIYDPFDLINWLFN